jgi:hypothetical protein
MLHGRCPGMGRQPIQQSRVDLDNYAAQASREYAAAQRIEAKAEADERAAYEGVRGDVEPGAYAERPRAPRFRSEIYRSDEDKARQAAYDAANAAWRAKFPKHAALEDAQHAKLEANRKRWQCQQMHEHFVRLQKVADTLLGQSLTEEVVA